MELFDNLALGFGVAFTFQNLIYCFVGCLLGTLIEVAEGHVFDHPATQRVDRFFGHHSSPVSRRTWPTMTAVAARRC